MNAANAKEQTPLGAQMIDVQTVAKKLGLSTITIRRWEKEKRFPQALKLNGALRWRLEVVDSWIAAQEGCR